MQPGQSRLGYLFQKYFDKTASPDERAEFARLIEDPANKEETMQLFSGTWEGYEGDGTVVPSERSEVMLQHILDSSTSPLGAPVIEMRKGRAGRRVAIAAALILIAGGVWMLSHRGRPAGSPPAVVQAPLNVPPGSNGAILTLDDGKQIVLDSAHNGLIAQQGNTMVTKQTDGLTYNGAGKAQGTMTFNTISTSRGRQYPNLVLEDGTKVWLDAGSSIRFPVVFQGNERRVEITGQVWFDVVHNEQQPFKVMARGVGIMDIGTQFNVKAYEDEDKMKVTLIEGAVSIGDVLLKPGQQAQVPRDGRVEVGRADLDQALAWKNGFFSFRDADIRTVMREVARWYDLEVVYEGTNYPETFSGKIGRGLTLRDLLDGLAQTRVHYRIEGGRKLVILP